MQPTFSRRAFLAAALAPLANRDANADARGILAYLAQLPERADKRVIAGQHIGNALHPEAGYKEHIGDLQASTGKWLGLIGVDYGFTDGYEAANRVVTEHWKAGGLVTISCHAANPFTGGSAWDNPPHDLNELIEPGTKAHENWMAQLDRLATAFAALQETGVVILWRPFHEMNGAWFWWGQTKAGTRRKEEFTNLWKHMFAYFTATKRLNNLLWVYSASSGAHSKTPVDFFYPGEEYCDIVGLDNYSDDMEWNGYAELARLGKPFAATEIGPAKKTRDGSFNYSILMDRIARSYPRTTYFMAWARECSLVHNRGAAELLSHPWVITRESLKWKQP